MIFIINNKKYNTKKMEKIADVKKWYEYENSLIKGMGITRDCEMYKSKKGNWLLVHKTDYAWRAEAISEDEAQKLLLRYDYEKYEELFGEIEEA